MADKVTVNIQTDDEKLDFSFSPSDSILQVKKSVEDLVQWKVETLSLFYNGQELNNDRSLESYNLKEGVHANFDLVRPTSESSEPELAPKFHVRVKSNYTEEVLIRVRRGYFVSHLKNKIRRKCGLTGAAINLTHNDILMRDFYHLFYYNISENSVIKFDFKEDDVKEEEEDEEDVVTPYRYQGGR